MSNYSKKRGGRLTQKKLVIGLVVVVILAVVGIGVGLHVKHSHKKVDANIGARPTNSVDYSHSKPSQQTINNDRKNSAPPSGGSTLNTPSETAPFSVTITRASVDNTDRQVIVGTLVEGATSGSCTLSLTQTGQSNVTATSSVSQQNNGYACNNFVVPFSRFPHTGEWHATVSVAANNAHSSDTWQSAIVIPNE